ncbi:MAG: hypothetical protein HY765_05030 [Rhodomicrobium sp.]|nr:hypothetical protein [Rhodomicrobium sp.]
MRLFFIASILAAGQILSGFAQADCPVSGHSIDAIVQAIESAPDCQASHRTMSACLFGASGDVPLAEAVIKKCEASFLAKLTQSELRTYERERAACVTKYAKMQGTMYISAAAACEASVALRYSRKRRPIR